MNQGSAAPIFRSLDASEFEHVVRLERSLLSGLGEVELAMAEWSQPWRRESLEFYLPKGWSVGAWQGERLVGYFLGQPLLFWGSETQTLWVEHLSAPTPDLTAQLIDVAIRYSRDKHLQRVVFAQGEALSEHLTNFRATRSPQGILQILTTKR